MGQKLVRLHQPLKPRFRGLGQPASFYGTIVEQLNLELTMSLLIPTHDKYKEAKMMHIVGKTTKAETDSNKKSANKENWFRIVSIGDPSLTQLTLHNRGEKP